MVPSGRNINQKRLRVLESKRAGHTPKNRAYTIALICDDLVANCDAAFLSGYLVVLRKRGGTARYLIATFVRKQAGGNVGVSCYFIVCAVISTVDRM